MLSGVHVIALLDIVIAMYVNVRSHIIIIAYSTT